MTLCIAYAQHIAERLLNTGIWWRTKRDHYCAQTFWYWDGKDSWYLDPFDNHLHYVSFTPESMDSADDMERVTDPRISQ